MQLLVAATFVASSFSERCAGWVVAQARIIRCATEELTKPMVTTRFCFQIFSDSPSGHPRPVKTGLTVGVNTCRQGVSVGAPRTASWLGLKTTIRRDRYCDMDVNSQEMPNPIVRREILRFA